MPTKKASAALSLIVLLVALILPAPVAAATAPNPSLPPLPEWPILGPLLQQLGLVTAPDEVVATPDPSLPEYRIRDFEDLDMLDEVPPGERVRLIATDSDLNQMAGEVLHGNFGENAGMTLDVADNEMMVQAQATRDVVEQYGIVLPRFIRGGMLNVSTTFSVDAANCAPYVDIDKVTVNGWSFGLRPLAERTLNAQIPEVWPAELCVEGIFLMDGEIAAEGYYTD